MTEHLQNEKTGASAQKVAVIVTSTRPIRVGPKVGDWVKSVIDRYKDKSAKYELVHVADYNLPLFDEVVLPATVPAMAQYTKDHSKAWSEKISQYAGHIWVINEYNFGPSAATKNAIDFLYNEIINKPQVIISYGVFGGQKASEAINATLEGMKTKVQKTRPALPFHGNQGPDLFAAAGQGELGEDTKTDWERERKAEVEKALSELEQALQEAAAPYGKQEHGQAS